MLGKPFQLLCQSNSGTLPISYTLYGPGKLNESKVVSKPGDMAIFNCPAIFKSLDLSKFLCHARNHKNKVPMIGSGQLMLKSTNIIGKLCKNNYTLTFESLNCASFLQSLCQIQS